MLKNLLIIFSSAVSLLYGDPLSSRLTIITTTSPEFNHPSTTCLEITQVSLAKYFPDFLEVPKIIVFDGPRDEKIIEKYDQFKKNVQRLVESNPIFKNTKLIFCEEHKHLSGAIEEALDYTDTKYIFIHQDDFVLLRSFKLAALLDAMDRYPEIQHVRLNSLTNWDLSTSTPGEVRDMPNYGDQYFQGDSEAPIIRTFCWSDNDHITSVEYYRNIVIPAVDGRKMAMEFAVPHYLGTLPNQTPFDCGLYIYGESLDPQMIYHLDRHSSVW